jgi:hypothetical protein
MGAHTCTGVRQTRTPFPEHEPFAAWAASSVLCMLVAHLLHRSRRERVTESCAARVSPFDRGKIWRFNRKSMEGWTVERVQQLAPDAASAKAGQGLAGPRKWVSLGCEASTLWGECQGSGAKPYQVRVDLAEPAYKCSCPSRKFPCKHSLGLMLMFVGGSVPTSTKPAWVEEWVAQRNARAEKKQEKAESPPKPVDAAAQAKRKENRLERVSEGLSALKRWLVDLARTGLATMPSHGYAFFDEPARRLIDAQAPGVARRVQALAAIASSGTGWQRPFLEQLSLLYLLVQGFERRESLPEATRELLSNVIGLPRPQEEVLALPPVVDRWQIVAQEVTVEDRLRAQHTWLIGERTGSAVQVLAFAHGNMPLDVTLPPGFAFEGEVCLHPGDALRGLVKTRGDLSPLARLAGAATIDTIRDAYATQRAGNPWLEGFAAIVDGATIQQQAETWLAIDAAGHALPLELPERDAWTLLAVTGGARSDLVVHFDGVRGRVLAATVDGQYVRLAARVEAA